ncbi:Electron transport complex protein RnfC [hydrothermal vent metagenome]|uniref:Electron transport complex protein RnfC n=1 Tax=hydrothermal vent metagenome TaxID=652676 RepID=A0A3B1BZQ4_9ZZZZ
MNPFRRLTNSFDHGVHPSHHKERTEGLPIQRLPFGRRFVIPLGQHIGAPAEPVVQVGDSVKRGQMIAEPVGFISVALHSPVTGKVSGIGPNRHVDGTFQQAIEIEADPYDTQQMESAPIEWESLSVDDFAKEVQQAGIVGLGGAAFPCHVKYALPEEVQTKHLLINGAECEPYLTNDHRVMLERPETLLAGAEMVRQKLGAEEIVIGVEKNKPDAIAALQNQIKPGQPVRIMPLEVKYPQGAEKMLIKSVFGIEVPAGKLPKDVRVAVNNVATIVAIADYFQTGMPLIERVVTVSGPGVSYPANVIVPLGTSIREVLEFAGGLKEETRQVILGGPMMGASIADLDAPMLKGSSGVLALTEKETGRPEEHNCIRCGRCVEACPYFLNPARFARLAKSRMFEAMAENYNLMDCVECGCCTYSCPSGIPIVQHIRTAKNHLRTKPQVKEA